MSFASVFSAALSVPRLLLLAAALVALAVLFAGDGAPPAYAEDPEDPYIVQLSVAQDTVREGASVTVHASLNKYPPATGMAVGFTTSGTATQGGDGDYTLSANAVVIAPDELVGSVTLRVVDDNRVEPDETIVITGTIRYADFEPVQHSITLTIEDNDGAPPAQAQQTASVSFPFTSRLALEIDQHGVRFTRLYTVAVDPPLESDSAVHVRIRSNSTATYGEDYTMAMPNAPGTTTTKVLQLPAGASQVSFGMWFKPDRETEGFESVNLELVAIENAPYRVEDDYRSRKYMDLEVVILDNSRPAPYDADPERGIDIQPESVIAGPTAATVSYTVALTSMPDSDVTVKAYLDRREGPLNIGLTGGELSVSPASLTFDSSNWSTPQTFTVSTNGTALGLEELISHGVESTDDDYNTDQWFQGPGIDEERHIKISVVAGGL